jgi:hypothetical protein
LTTEQRVLLEGANVREDEFGTTTPRFMMNKPLFESIADRVRILDRVVKLGASVHESVTGSVCQTQWQERDETSIDEFSRGTQYTEREVRQCANSKEDLRITIGALMTSLRVRKEQIINLRSYNCYDFGAHEHVPDAWHLTRNRIFNHGNVSVWNTGAFRSAFRGKDDLRTAWIQKSLMTYVA